jgi:hypothetical protein
MELNRETRHYLVVSQPQDPPDQRSCYGMLSLCTRESLVCQISDDDADVLMADVQEGHTVPAAKTHLPELLAAATRSAETMTYPSLFQLHSDESYIAYMNTSSQLLFGDMIG